MYNKFKRDYLCKNCEIASFGETKCLNSEEENIIKGIGLPETAKPELYFGGSYCNPDSDDMDKLEEMFDGFDVIGKHEEGYIIVADGEVRIAFPDDEYDEYANEDIAMFAESVYEYNRFINEMVENYITGEGLDEDIEVIEDYLTKEDIEELKDRIGRIEKITKNSFWERIIEDLSQMIDLEENKKEEPVVKEYNKFRKNRKEYKVYMNGELSSIYRYDEKGDNVYIKTKNTIYSKTVTVIWREHEISYEHDKDGRIEFEEHKIFVGEERKPEHKTIKYTYDDKNRLVHKDIFSTMNDKGHYEYIWRYLDFYNTDKTRKCFVFYKDKNNEYIDTSTVYDEEGVCVGRLIYHHSRVGDIFISEPSYVKSYKYNDMGLLSEETINDVILNKISVRTYEYEENGDTLTQYEICDDKKEIVSVYKLDSKGNFLEHRAADGTLRAECTYW